MDCEQTTLKIYNCDKSHITIYVSTCWRGDMYVNTWHRYLSH